MEIYWQNKMYKPCLWKRNWFQPAWWSDGESCWLLGWPGGGAGGRTLWREPASAAETPAALLSSTKRMRSYCGRLVRTSAEKCAARFPALVAELWRTQLSAYWYARLSKPFFDWMTCTVRRGLLHLLSCHASSGRWSQCCTGCRRRGLWIWSWIVLHLSFLDGERWQFEWLKTDRGACIVSKK